MSKKFVEEPKIPVPGYIVTFSDMITLLLTFFVMLLSMAKTQVEKHKFEVGIQSFKRAIADFGMTGMLTQQNSGLEFSHPKVYYRVEVGQDEPEDRSIDAKTEMLRRVLMDIEKMMKISPSHITAKTKTAFPTNIRFDGGGWTLNNTSQQTLNRLAEQFKISFSGQQPTLYVLAIAADVPEAQSWAVSAKRAAAAAAYLRQQLGTDIDWPIYSWGAGQGGEWVGHNGLVTRQTQILINALTEAK